MSQGRVGLMRSSLHSFVEQFRWMSVGISALVLLFFMTAHPAHAANLNLQVSITDGLLQDDETTDLPDNSIVYVILSTGTVNPPVEVGGGLIADSTTGGDLLLATLRIDQDGIFFPQSAGIYDSSIYTHVYLRFFDYQGSEPVEGTNFWGTTEAVLISTTPFGIAFADFAGGDAATNENVFVVIPEPGTMGLLLMAGGIFASLGFCSRRRFRNSELTDP
jgi:hypothetical protein